MYANVVKHEIVFSMLMYITLWQNLILNKHVDLYHVDFGTITELTSLNNIP